MIFTEEQQSVIDTRKKNILVSAAAGSGKTAVLVERIIGLVMDDRDPYDIDRILTVTFTNAAASEMRERIRKRFSDLSIKDPGNERIARQLSLIHNANIMTIDSFCVKVLRENFEELALDPAFRVGDENEVDLLREEAVDEILDEAYEEGAREFFDFLDACSALKDDRNVAENIMLLSKEADSRAESDEWLSSLVLPYEDTENSWEGYIMDLSALYLENVIRGYERLTGLCDTAAGPYMYKEILESERVMAENILDIQSYIDRYKAFQDLSFKNLPSKRDENVDPELRERVKNARGKLKDRLNDLKKEFFSKSPEKAREEIRGEVPFIRELVELTYKFRERFREKKEKRNILDFSDVEHLAFEVLKGEAGDAYRDFFKEVMTDEYQDSNNLQEAILTLVAGEENYFCVGDVKQSIYSFRLAEPGIFLRRFSAYENDPKSVRILLNKNFRSRKACTDAVNSLFRCCMHKETGGVEYDEEQELCYGEGYDEDRDDHKAEFLLIEEGEDSEAEGIELEAALIADRISEMRGNYDITEVKDGGIKKRKAEYSDFAILLRSPSGSDEEIRDVLRSRGIPAATDGRTGYFKTREIRDVLNYLIVLDNPRQDIPLIALMKSPFGGFNDGELAVIRASQAEGLFIDALNNNELPDELRKKADLFLNKIGKYRDMVSYTPIHELIRILIKDEYSLYISSLSTRGAENLSLLIKRAADYEKTSYRGLFRFLKFIEKMKKYELDFGEASDNSGGNAVRIMSVHKSKGLEFPVVFLANTDKRFNMRDAEREIVCHRDLGIGISVTDPVRKVRHDSLIKKAVSKRIKLDCIGEELRILYVALTRAKEKLIVTGSVKDYDKAFGKPCSPSEAGSFLDFFISAFSGAESNEQKKLWKIGKVRPEELIDERLDDFEILETERAAVTDTQDLTEADFPDKIWEKISWVYPHNSAITTPSKVSVSELKMAAIKDHEFVSIAESVETVPIFSEEEDAIKEEEKRKALMKLSAEKGTAFHKVMSLLPPDMERYEDDIKGFLRELAEKGSLLPEEEVLIDPKDISRFLKTGLYKRMNEALKRKELFREQPFIVGRNASEVYPDAPEDETIQIQGIIDAFFIEDGKIIVMDYKTDHVKDAGILIKRYRTQLDLYAGALTQLLGMSVSEKIIYSVALNKEIVL